MKMIVTKGARGVQAGDSEGTIFHRIWPENHYKPTTKTAVFDESDILFYPPKTPRYGSILPDGHPKLSRESIAFRLPNGTRSNRHPTRFMEWIEVPLDEIEFD